jgi:hypothetical protein
VDARHKAGHDGGETGASQTHKLHERPRNGAKKT